MAMGRFPVQPAFGLILAIFLILVHVSDASPNVCPSRDFIAPCTCKPAAFGSQVVCTNVHHLRVLQRVFDVLKNYQVATLLLHGMRVHTLPNDLFGDLQVSMLRIVDSEFALEREGYLFSGLENSLEHLDILHCEIRGTLHSPSLSHLTRLVDVQIENTIIHTLKRQWFHGGPSDLEVITMESNGIKIIEDGAFAGLQQVNRISLSGNEITTLKREIFPTPASALAFLDLSYNNLTELPQDIFMEMPQLNHVELAGNKIETLPEATWSPIWNQLQYISIKDNPLHCDHRLLWLSDMDVPKVMDIKCASPETLQNVPLHLYIRKNLRRRRNQ